MMMTYRLLCALLVLALCCCPSVHAGDTQEPSEGQGTAKDPNLSPTSAESRATAPNGNVAGPAPSQTGGLPVDGQAADDSANEPAADKIEPEASGLVVPGPKVNNVSNTSLTENAKGNKGSEIGTGAPADKEVNNAEASFEATTTTTTKSPTTTTTTTTTTQAPSTTTTEAPAVSTTRAPSRLREIDGSLSSSAWVCAPLVLAASALAYTAVG
ncbi:putative mucin TcMUCII [Trypanosoma cruzi]|uniref:Mucin TcMUCII, putative n=3 Tax=Trypanosoma cruzi TaxID=5693 RepID=Q4DTK6_TRYCC|nr:mucin TcMUCII, putative [Trypanosoma cruzi]XP_818317.1 mucin TcMUCII, putative [Trypanosoma cruzi]EAN95866.1 mucin TcMUCII, putative [Trypanosoma cruzi]EAN96466.1 mucin TcMUCII, putative [Trypanosoma cruzi]PWV15834.1 putative mucin TcMUCII [Trypanosoma cruzi]PWV15876.1 putative mucin TcMUCII [Trypanosoma cruzi]PWV15877.1 putative mucin TcMUCII [Trypanosoma cruzi]|eukprot:XP_817717.1 mucin TcMUCII [Trypanosoma cruzi strain CL Brener]